MMRRESRENPALRQSQAKNNKSIPLLIMALRIFESPYFAVLFMPAFAPAAFEQAKSSGASAS